MRWFIFSLVYAIFINNFLRYVIGSLSDTYINGQDPLQDPYFVGHMTLEVVDGIEDIEIKLEPDYGEFPDNKAGSYNLGCFLILCRNNELYAVLETLQNVQDRFNSKYNYPYVFLNDEPFDAKFIYSVKSFLNTSQVFFGQVPLQHWSYPEFINQSLVLENMNRHLYVYANSHSYRHMCRFYLGFFYKHPLLSGFKYFWRLEPGVKLLCDVPQDLFKEMSTRGKKYAFTLTMFEYSETIPTLWDTFKEFIQLSPQYLDSATLLELITNDDGSYNLCHFWSNFEIADLDIFRDPNYDQFFQYFDRKGGFYYERWGDAPFHTLYIALYLHKLDLWWLNQVGYLHDPYLQCPQNLQIYEDHKCICDPDYDFTDSFQSCTRHFLRVLNN